MMLLLDAIASIILMGMMLVPIVNLVAGGILGAALGGVPGGVAGLLLAVAVTVAEKMIADRRGWFGAIAEVGNPDVSVGKQSSMRDRACRARLTRRRALGSPKTRHRPAAPPAAADYRQPLH